VTTTNPSPRTEAEIATSALSALVGCGIVSAYIGDPTEWNRAMEQIPVEEVWISDHREALRAMRRLMDRGEPMDPLLIEAEAHTVGASVSLSFLWRCASECLAPVLWKFHLRIVRQYLDRSRAQREVSELMKSIETDELENVGAILAALGTRLLSVAGADLPVDGRTLAEETYEEVKKASERGGSLTHLYEFPLLEKQIAGLYPGEMLLLGAKTSAGKSTWIKCLALACSRAGMPFGILSLEDRRTIYGARVLADMAGVEIGAMRTGTMCADDWERFMAKLDVLKGLPIYVAHLGKTTTARAVGALAQLVARGAKMVAVDYLQQIDDQDRRGRHPEISSAAGALKLAAGRLGIPLILATQWSGEWNKSDTPPDLRAAKESGDVENQAEAVVWIWHDEQGGSKLYVRKAKSGQRGEIPLVYDGRFARMYEGKMEDW